MAIDHRIGNKVIKSQRREEAPGTRVDPHPYIGIVKNNLDPTRSGRLQVWIPDLGGNPDDSKNWRTVSYSSPFFGTTNIKKTVGNKTPNTDNKFTNTPHTYGMWMVPPDIGVEVICIFIGGDPLRGYCIGCINSSLSRFMIPGIAGSRDTDTSGASADIKQSYTPGIPAPVTEFNETDPNVYQNPAFYRNPKPIHEPQYRILREQGLDRDVTRGIITSSSQRESPSQVFGISTPGRPFPDNGADQTEEFLAKVQAGTLTQDDYAFTTRKGGHTFIMDDGGVLGDDQLVRIRSANGHQIMMHDTDNTLYINHADGISWIELTPSGAINVFSNNGFSVRSKGTINLHSDKDININAAKNISMSAGKKWQIDAGKMALLSRNNIEIGAGGGIMLQSDGVFNVDSAASVSLKSGGTLSLVGSSIKQNSGGGVSVNKPAPLQVNSLSDVTRDLSSGLYKSSVNLSSIVTVAPSHEPYDRGIPPPTAPPESPGIQPSETYKETYDATKNSQGTSFSNPAGEKELRNQPIPNCEVGNLSTEQLTAFFTQIGKSESGGRYEIVNSIGFAGKYQFGYLALIDTGYVKRSCRSNSQLRNPNNWTGKDGVDSLEKWLTSPGAQEAAMCDLTKRNYSTLCKIGALNKDMPPEEVAGMLAVSHLLGAGGAKKWRNGQGGSDAYGTTGDSYFQKGKYAVAVLAPKVSTVNQG